MNMKFGLVLPYAPARHDADLALLAEDAGWDGVFLGDAIWCVDPMIVLTAAAMVTTRIRLGTLITPIPIRIPWKLASESAALDNLSNGRLILGLGTGAVWMGWQCFPDEVTDTKARTEMLDEGIDILTLLFKGKQFDYDGKHYHVRLTQMEERHFPPLPAQKPRIPLWCVGVWPRKKSMQRTLKCDGVIPNKMNREGKFEDLTPADVREMRAFVAANRTLTTPFDIVVEGRTAGFSRQQAQEAVSPWNEAGATWWMEGLASLSDDEAVDRIRQGPPRLD
jgi:alkanesulfonate monooxygenase SsuD/methylene tetrahydromethanopterin reductase-like flavin-dependent oxidoreductase (luciferase family)